MQIKRSMTFLFIFFLNYTFIMCEIVEKCESEKIQFSKLFGSGNIEGYIYAELDTNTTDDLVFVKNLAFYGSVQYDNESQIDLRVKFDSIKAVRIQRILGYSYNEGNETATKSCHLGFIVATNTRLGVPYVVQHNILRIAQKCITKVVCEFDHENHRLGDNILVQPRSHKLHMLKPTLQETVNGAIDLAINKLVYGLAAANLSIIKIPNFELSGFGWSFQSTNGIIDILTHIKRVSSFELHYEGHKFSIGTTFNLTGGIIELYNVTLRIGFIPIRKNLSIPVTGISLRMEISVNNNVSPCVVTGDEVDLHIPNETFLNIISNDFVRYALTSALSTMIEYEIKSYVNDFSCSQGKEILKS